MLNNSNHKYRGEVQVVIGTPGRILDYIRRGDLKFEATKSIVIDEADQMFHVGFKKDIDEIPTHYYLSNNYPNPFNPSTMIKFTIADFGFTILKVYDVLGNEVATLVDEYKPAGSYEVEFNSVGTSRDLSLTSGVNFYQLKIYPANGGTNKMRLIRIL